jgi:hypothetical protein
MRDNKKTNCISIKVSDKELEALNEYIYNSFVLNEQESFTIVLSQGYLSVYLKIRYLT